MNLKNLFIVLFLSSCSIFIVSCSKDNDEEIVENKTYELKEISWILKDGDGQEIIEMKLPELVFRNDGNSTMDCTIKPLAEMKGTSQFYNDDVQTFLKLDGNEVNISIPSGIEFLYSSDYTYFAGGIKVPFRRDESTFPFSTQTTQTIGLPPHAELRYNATVYLQKITATYLARIGEKEGFDSYETSGKWIGVFYHTMNSSLTINDIKH